MTAELPTDIAEMSYEKAFAELESVVQRLESEPPMLEESINLFERGQALAQRCAQLLDQAELKLHTLTGRELESLSEEANR